MRRPITNRFRFALAVTALASAGTLAVAPASVAAKGRPTKSHPRAARCANADVIPSTANLAAVRSATLCLINVERRARGLRSLRSNSRLRSAAQSYAQDMVARNFFSHVSPTGSTVLQRIRKTAYLNSVRAWAVGENLAWGSGELATPAQTVQNWMNSPPHRHNMLDRGFREIGIGVALGVPSSSDPGATYTTEFGRRS